MKFAPATATPAKLPGTSCTMRDQLMEAWRAACDETALAYWQWCNAPVTQRRNCYTVYLAAADREAAAETAFLKTTRGR